VTRFLSSVAVLVIFRCSLNLVQKRLFIFILYKIHAMTNITVQLHVTNFRVHLCSRWVFSYTDS